jgi:selenide,water dikinase
MNFDLLSTVETGGCSAKLAPDRLAAILKDLPIISNSNVMVDIQTHDDAGVYRLNDTTALIVTTDFFPPMCSNAYDFGQIAAANALSDVYAMGGDPLLALNLMMFPSTAIPLEVFKDILRGGNDKVAEANTLIMGGHTIDDAVPKYGLAVVGTVHPDNLITNAGAKAGQHLVLTKPLGMGVMMAAHKHNLNTQSGYESALELMKQLNKTAKEVMQKYHVKGATDITGFGLAGHTMQMAKASKVSFRFDTHQIPVISNCIKLLDDGCIPGATWRNHKYTKEEVRFSSKIALPWQLLCCDAQTSGGMLFAIDAQHSQSAINDLHAAGILSAAVIGEVIPQSSKWLWFE